MTLKSLALFCFSRLACTRNNTLELVKRQALTRSIAQTPGHRVGDVTCGLGPDLMIRQGY